MTIKEIIKHALDAMYDDERNAHILKNKSSERSLVAVFKTYFENVFRTEYSKSQNDTSNYDIDLEYNLHGKNKKRIEILHENTAKCGIMSTLTPDQRKAIETNGILNKLIYPDLIVHKRGKNNNLGARQSKRIISNQF